MFRTEKSIAISGVLPWLSLDAESRESYYEPQDRINKCLHCTEAKCVNCLANNQERQKDNRLEAFSEMVANKKSQREICASLQISRATYFNYKNQLAMCAV